MSQMDEHNSTHTLLSAQMKNLNVSWLLSLVVLFGLSFAQYLYFVKKKTSQIAELSLLRYFFPPISNACNFSSNQVGHISPSTLLFVLHFVSIKL